LFIFHYLSDLEQKYRVFSTKELNNDKNFHYNLVDENTIMILFSYFPNLKHFGAYER